MNSAVSPRTTEAGIARLWAVLRHAAAVAALLVVAFTALRVTADDGTWYLPQEPGGDPDGFLLAVLSAMTVVGPLLLVAYGAGFWISRRGARR